MRFCELSVNVLSTAEPIWTDSSTKRDWVWSPQKFDLLFLQRATTSETEFFLPRLGLGHARPLSFYDFSRCAERFRSLGPSLLPGPLWGDKQLSLWERPATTSAGEGMANQNALCTCKTGGAFRWTIGNGIWLALTICSLTHRVATLIAESQCHTAEHTNPELLLRINRWPVRSGNFAKSYFLRKKREFLNPFSCVRREGKPTICTVVLPNQCWNPKSQRGYIILVRPPHYQVAVIGRKPSSKELPPNPKPARTALMLIPLMKLNKFNSVVLVSGYGGDPRGRTWNNVLLGTTRQQYRRWRWLE